VTELEFKAKQPQNEAAIKTRNRKNDENSPKKNDEYNAKKFRI
jgi:hypothetical protein